MVRCNYKRKDSITTGFRIKTEDQLDTFFKKKKKKHNTLLHGPFKNRGDLSLFLPFNLALFMVSTITSSIFVAEYQKLHINLTIVVRSINIDDFLNTVVTN